MIRNEALVINKHGSALEHFDFQLQGSQDDSHLEDIRGEEKTLEDLIERWSAAMQPGSDTLPPWADEMIEEMRRAIVSKPASPPSQLMKSTRTYRNDWFYPLVNHVRRMPDDRMEFVVYMYRLESSARLSSACDIPHVCQIAVHDCATRAFQPDPPAPRDELPLDHKSPHSLMLGASRPWWAPQFRESRS